MPAFPLPAQWPGNSRRQAGAIVSFSFVPLLVRVTVLCCLKFSVLNIVFHVINSPILSSFSWGKVERALVPLLAGSGGSSVIIYC